MLVLAIALLFSNSAEAVPGIPKAINLNNGLTSECFVWADPFSLEEKTVEIESYPAPTVYFAKKAYAGKCDQRHHFQIFYRKPIQTSDDKVFNMTLSKSFCKKKATSTLKGRNLPSYIYAARVGNKKEGFLSACLMTGSTSLGFEPKTYYFEELFESRVVKKRK